MIVFITGVTGFLGCSLARYFHAQGCEVRGSSRSADRLGKLSGLLSSGFEHTFDRPANPQMYSGCEAIIHCAHDFLPKSGPRTISGTAHLRKAAQQAGVQQQLFVSSYSARPDALSEYGQTKYIIEQEFLASGLTIIRPGLIVGPGGLFAQTAKGLLKAPCIPLPEGGCAPAPVISLKDLLDAIYQIIRDKKNGAYNLFTSEVPTIKDFISAVCTGVQKKPQMFNISTGWIRTFNKWLRGCGIPVPDGLERIDAMYLNLHRTIHTSDLPMFLKNPLNAEQMIVQACNELLRHT